MKKEIKDLKVLVIDDSKIICRINSNVLGMLDITDIDVAMDGKSGLDLFTNKDYDLVLCDINMPILDGFGFVAGARKTKTKEECPIFMITTEGGREEVMKALKLGANNYLTKPLKKESLIQKIIDQFN